MEARERERTRWAREIHDESIQGIGALRLQLANARDIDDTEALSAAPWTPCWRASATRSTACAT